MTTWAKQTCERAAKEQIEEKLKRIEKREKLRRVDEERLNHLQLLQTSKKEDKSES